MNIKDLLTHTEGKTLEFKRDLSSPQNILKTLIAFSNTAGGILLIGVDDITKSIFGIQHPLDDEERLCNLITDAIEPRLLPNIELIAWEDKTLLAVEVFPSPLRPHYLKSQGSSGVFVRLGSTNRQADADLIIELRRSVTGIAFDEQPMQEFDADTIDIQAATELFQNQRKISEKELETLRIFTRIEKKYVPTVGGLLLLGKNREQIFPDAWIQCGRFAGTDKTHILDHTEIHTHLPLAVERIMEFLKKHAMRGADLSQLHRRDVWSIPVNILREAIINAVVHTDYSQKGAPIRVSFFDDRIEIENPGILLPGLTIEDIQQGVSKLRNRVIGRVFRELGLIEQWGSGIRRMFTEAEKLGLPAPIINEVGMRYRLTIFLQEPIKTSVLKQLAGQSVTKAEKLPSDSRAQSEGPVKGPSQGAHSQQVLLALLSAPLSMQELIDALGLKSKTGALKRTVNELLTEHCIEYTLPDKPNSRLQKYRITEKGKTLL